MVACSDTLDLVQPVLHAGCYAPHEALFIISRYYFVSFIIFSILSFSAQANPINSDCTFKGFPLMGNVKVVESFEDIRVQIVTSFPDLKVKTVSSFPDRCGMWKMVESFPDFTIKFVTSFPDIKIQFVESFPGL